MPAFTRRNVFLRDGYRCQYCGGLFRTSDLSLDHVNPRCFGGRLTWYVFYARAPFVACAQSKTEACVPGLLALTREFSSPIA